MPWCMDDFSSTYYDQMQMRYERLNEIEAARNNVNLKEKEVKNQKEDLEEL
jgi:hypothetical protein